MAATTYTYSVSTDTANGAIHSRTLNEEIRGSAIVTALDAITVAGDVLSVTFKDSLSSGDKTTLDGIISAHAGVEVVKVTPPKTSTGVPLVQHQWREGSATDFITFNWCDRTTWYQDSVRVTDEALTDSGDGLTWNSANTDWICVTQGKIPQEHRLQSTYAPVITVDSTAKTESSPGTTDGDYQIDYATGAVTFNASQAGKVVKATYSYAQTSTFYVTPDTDKTLRLTAVEVQFSDDINLTDSVRFDIEGLVEVFAPQMVDDVNPDYVNTFPTGTQIPLGNPRIYNTMMDYVAEAQRAYPQVPALGGASWRGLSKPLYVMRWPYQEDATRDLINAYGMRIKIKLVGDTPFGGTFAVATLYSVSIDSVL